MAEHKWIFLQIAMLRQMRTWREKERTLKKEEKTEKAWNSHLDDLKYCICERGRKYKSENVTSTKVLSSVE